MPPSREAAHILHPLLIRSELMIAVKASQTSTVSRCKFDPETRMAHGKTFSLCFLCILCVSVRAGEASTRSHTTTPRDNERFMRLTLMRSAVADGDSDFSTDLTFSCAAFWKMIKRALNTLSVRHPLHLYLTESVFHRRCD